MTANRKKPDPLPADPLDALATAMGLAEDAKRAAEEAHRKVERAIDDAQAAAEKAEALYRLLDAWFADRIRRGEPEPACWQD